MSPASPAALTPVMARILMPNSGFNYIAKFIIIIEVALFYSSVNCTGAPKYPNKDILVHRCNSPMNKTTHPDPQVNKND